MSRIRIHNEVPELKDDAPFYRSNVIPGYGTEVHLDGKVVRAVRSVDLHVGLEAATATVELLASDALNAELDASVTVNIVAFDPGYDIEETPLENGGKRYRAVERSQVKT